MDDLMQHLSVLKVKLVTAKDFFEVFTYFFDHLGENSEFMNIGESTRHDLLEQVLPHTAKPILQSSVVVMREGIIIKIPEHNFLHGACFLNEYLANFFYFEDIDAGMMALARSMSEGHTQIIRFSLKVLGEKPNPPTN